MFRPHKWRAVPPTVEISDGVALSPEYTGGQYVHGQISGLTAEAACASYAVEVTRGYELLMNVDDAKHHPVSAKVIHGRQLLKVRAPALIQQQGLPADHARVLCEEIRNDA
jgi:hypothetical protein